MTADDSETVIEERDNSLTLEFDSFINKRQPDSFKLKNKNGLKDLGRRASF